MSASDQTLSLSLREARAKRSPLQYSREKVIALVGSDLAMFVLSSFLGLSLVAHTSSMYVLVPTFFHSSIVFVGIWVICFERFGLYKRSLALSVKDEFYYTITALILGILPQFVLFTVIPSFPESRLGLLLSAAFAVVSVGGSRATMHAISNVVGQRRPRRIAIVGISDRIQAVAESLNMVDGTSLLRLSVPDIDETVKPIVSSEEALIDDVEWFRTATAWKCDTLLLTEILAPNVMPHILEVAARRHIKVAFAPPRVRCHAYSLSLAVDGQQALIVPSQLRACTPRARLLKRLLDLSIAVPASILLSPLMLIIAISIWLESGSPIIFRQRRVGRSGEVFDILKFRSMRNNAETGTGPIWARRGDSRATKFGSLLRKLSLDELPQLFNVIRGDMSIVGPRPELPNFVREFRRLLPRYAERHLMRPGITGMSQINMPRMLEPMDAGEVLSFDLFYVEHWGLFMDISVLFKTAIEFLFHRAG